MFGLIQILIYLLCVYLIYKGVEIFQIAYVTSERNASRDTGTKLGICMIIAAIVIAVVAILMAQSIAGQLDGTYNIPTPIAPSIQ